MANRQIINELLGQAVRFLNAFWLTLILGLVGLWQALHGSAVVALSFAASAALSLAVIFGLLAYRAYQARDEALAAVDAEPTVVEHRHRLVGGTAEEEVLKVLGAGESEIE